MCYQKWYLYQKLVAVVAQMMLVTIYILEGMPTFEVAAVQHISHCFAVRSPQTKTAEG